MTEAFSRNIGKVSKRKYVSENSIFRLSGSVVKLQCGWRFAHISISSVKRVECGMWVECYNMLTLVKEASDNVHFWVSLFILDNRRDVWTHTTNVCKLWVCVAHGMFTSMVGTSSQNHNYTVQCMVLLVRMYICMWIAVMGLSLTWVTYSTTCEMGGGGGRGSGHKNSYKCWVFYHKIITHDQPSQHSGKACKDFDYPVVITIVHWLNQ